MPPVHGTQYIEGLLVGIQQNQARTEIWLQKFEAKMDAWLEKIEEDRKAEIKELTARVDAVEEHMTHDSAKRAAWNQLMGALLAIAGIAVSFFSGAFNHLFGKG
jgi:flagellar biosynthesis chaperone FliJ